MHAEEGFRSREIVWLLMIAFVVYVAVAQAIRNPWNRVPMVVSAAVAVSLPLLIRFMFCRGTTRAIARLTDVIEGRLAKAEASSP